MMTTAPREERNRNKPTLLLVLFAQNAPTYYCLKYTMIKGWM
jgi:hypothetical protein